MTVTVKLYSSLQQGRFQEEQRDYAVPVTVAQAAVQLNIKLDELGMVLINGRAVTLDHKLEEGDILSLFPLIGGG
ncbi:MAG: MoaD/ThiS family protein [Methylocystaceae bacterium]